jgi:predicted nuclease of predicted toxin-antitoxin system
MLRFLADENFNGHIVRGLQRRLPQLDILRVQDLELASAADPAILAWAAEQQRIVLTHDRSTMADFAYERIARNKPTSGLFVLGHRLPVALAIEELLLIWECSDHSEWIDRVVRLPL